MKRTVLQEEDIPGEKLLNDLTVEEPKRWLECHGLKKVGKDELIERLPFQNSLGIGVFLKRIFFVRP